MDPSSEESTLLRYTKGVALHLAQRKRLPPDQWDDAISEGYLGYLEALKSWRPGKGASLKSWIYFKVNSRVDRMRRSEWRWGRRLEAQEEVDSSIDPLLEAHIERVLDDREWAVLALHLGLHGGKRTMEEIGRELGVSSRTAIRLKASALRKLRGSIDSEGFT